MFQGINTPRRMEDKRYFDILTDAARLLTHGAGSNRKRNKQLKQLQEAFRLRGIDIILRDNPEALREIKKEMNTFHSGTKGDNEKQYSIFKNAW